MLNDFTGRHHFDDSPFSFVYTSKTQRGLTMLEMMYLFRHVYLVASTLPSAQQLQTGDSEIMLVLVTMGFSEKQPAEGPQVLD